MAASSVASALTVGPSTIGKSCTTRGEAALGLISLYEVDHSRQWLTAAGVALSHLALTRARTKDAPPDHWAVIATAKFLPHYDPSVSPASKAELIEHAARISLSFVRDQIRSPNSALDGAFDPTEATPAAATRLEALLAALEFLPDDGNGLRRQIEETVQRGVAFLLRAQITSGPYAGGMPGKVQTDFVSAKKTGSFETFASTSYSMRFVPGSGTRRSSRSTNQIAQDGESQIALATGSAQCARRFASY